MVRHNFIILNTTKWIKDNIKKTPEGVDSVFAVRANIRMKLSPEQKKIIDLLDKPQLVSSLLESKKISSTNDQRSDALLDLFEASVVRFHL